MRSLFLTIFSIFSIITSNYAISDNSLTGKVISQKDKSTLPGASVVLLKAADSTYVTGSSTDMDGNFTINSIGNGSFILKVTFLGYNDFFKNFNFWDTTKTANLNIGTIALHESATTLNEAVVVEKLPAVTQNADTSVYNADAYKTNPDATAEDLINKMPGITSQDGKVQAQGENVQRVLVDGKPFFGDDPNAVLKNIPAEIISKIQVFDQKSEQAQFTGVDDGNSVKTLNIVTKVEYRNGLFGKVYGGYGANDATSLDSRYKAGAVINSFKDERRISILGQINNVNEQNFSTEDLLGVLSSTSSRGRSGRDRGGYSGQRSGGGSSRGGGGGYGGGGGNYGGNNANDFLVDTKNGIAKAASGGLNYVDKWGPKMDVTASYFVNRSNTTAISNTFRQYVLPSDSGLIYKEQNTSDNINYNHRINLRFDYKIDTLNSILFQPRISIQNNSGNSFINGVNELNGLPISTTQNEFNSNLQAVNVTSTILYRRKFLKKGRTISLNLTPGYNSSNGTSNLLSQSTFSDTTSLVDQQSVLNKKGYVAGGNVTYTEPLSEKSQLQVNYNYNYNKDNSDKNTYERSPFSNDYNIIDTALSNTFKSQYTAHLPGLTFRTQTEKIQFSLGANYQLAELQSDQQFPTLLNTKRTFQDILPSASYQYNFTPKKNLRIYYRARTNPPAVEQLQNVINNDNPLQLTAGNPFLRQDYQHSLTGRYSSANTEKSTSFFILLSGTYSDNYIGNSTFIAANDTVLTVPGLDGNSSVSLLKGTQLSQPVNLQKYYSVRSFITYGIPVVVVKSNLNLNGAASYSHTPGLINSELNYSNSSSLEGGVVLSSNISPKVDFTLSSTSTYSKVENTLQKNLQTSITGASTNTFIQNTRAKVNWNFWRALYISSDISQQYNSGLASSLDRNIYLWNAAFAVKFLKDKNGDLRLSVYDILKQNQSIQRNITDTYFEDVQTNLLQRYFMLTFTYNIKQFKASNKETRTPTPQK